MGVLICADNFHAASLEKLIGRCVVPDAPGGARPRDDRVWEGEVIVPDLLLMPFSAPLPPKGPFFSPPDVDLFEQNVLGIASRQAKTLGVPAIMANKAGPWSSPLPLGLSPVVGSAFAGGSAIAKASGSVLARAGRDGCVLVTDVKINPLKKVWASKLRAALNQMGTYTVKMPSNYAYTRFMEVVGAAAYSMSWRRLAASQKVSPGGSSGAAGVGASAAAAVGVALAAGAIGLLAATRYYAAAPPN